MEPVHECGLCDGPLDFAGMAELNGQYATFVCANPDCGWWHIAIDCCHDKLVYP